MTLAGKVDDFMKDDFLQLAKSVQVKKPREIIQRAIEAAVSWPTFAAEAEVPKKQQKAIAKTHRLQLSIEFVGAIRGGIRCLKQFWPEPGKTISQHAKARKDCWRWRRARAIVAK